MPRHNRILLLSNIALAFARPGLKPPGYKVAPHQWGLMFAPNLISEPPPPVILSEAKNLAPLQEPWASSAFARPGLKPPGYKVAPHQWGLSPAPNSSSEPPSPVILSEAKNLAPLREHWTSLAFVRPGLKPPGYKAAPHQWGLSLAPNLISEPPSPVILSEAKNLAPLREHWTSLAFVRPGLKPPGYKVAPHQWGLSLALNSNAEPPSPVILSEAKNLVVPVYPALNPPLALRAATRPALKRQAATQSPLKRTAEPASALLSQTEARP